MHSDIHVLAAICFISFSLVSDCFGGAENGLAGPGTSKTALNGLGGPEFHSDPYGAVSPRFSKLDPHDMGIRFINPISEEAISRNSNLMNGSGLAAGDVDGDGRCDLYFCSITGENQLYRNLGDWRFELLNPSGGIQMAGKVSTGAVFVDVDGDRDLDLLVATLGDGVHYFANLGHGVFEDRTAFSGLGSRSGSTSLALGDVDGDSDLDLYVANYGAVSIVNSTAGARMVRVDGQWKITGPHADRLRIRGNQLEEVGEPDGFYINQGNGVFHRVNWNEGRFLNPDGVEMEEPWDYGLSVQIRDVNGDRAPDIYVCNDFQSPDRFWINQGGGFFRALPLESVRKESYSAMGMDFTDLDRDGLLDLFVVEMLGSTHSHRMRQGSSLRFDAFLSEAINARQVVARNTLFHQREDGSFAEIAYFSGLEATDWSWQPTFFDVDLDGFEDVLVVNGMLHDLQDRDTLKRNLSLRLNETGIPGSKVLEYPPLPNRNRAFRNQGDLRFKDSSEAWGFNEVGFSNSMITADLDLDGDLDVVVQQINGSPLVYRNNSREPRIAVRLEGQAPNTQAIGARIKLAGDTGFEQSREVIAGGRYLASDESTLTFATLPHKNGSMRLEVDWPDGLTSRVVAVQSGFLHVIQEPVATHSIQVEERDAVEKEFHQPYFEDRSHLIDFIHQEASFQDLAHQKLLPRFYSQEGPSVAWFDMNEDGIEELIIGSGRGFSPSVYLLNGNGDFEIVPWNEDWKASDDVLGLSGWFGSDGGGALLATLSSYETGERTETSLLRLLWDRDWPRITSLSGFKLWPSSPGPIAVGDIEGDGDLDVFTAGRVKPGRFPEAASSVLLTQVDGDFWVDDAFDGMVNELGLVSAVLWSDLDLDGYPELMVAREWDGILVYKNERGKLTRTEIPLHIQANHSELANGLPLSDLTGLWTSLCTGDFNNDGLMDLIAGNWGLNDFPRATALKPLQLIHGRHGRNDESIFLEAYVPGNSSVSMPVRNLEELMSQFPFLAGAYPSHAMYARADIDSLLQNFGEWKSIQRKNVKTTESWVFLNQHDGVWIAKPLPDIAQFSPVASMVVGDLNGDGNEDVFLGQNISSVTPSRSKANAGSGLWLAGDGEGGFTSVSSLKSGIRIDGDQRGCALSDFNQDGKIDLVVTQNQGPVKVYENQLAKPGIRIRLRGPRGNPFGYGAVLRWVFKDGEKGPARQVMAGGGTGSQSSATQVMGFAQRPQYLEAVWPGGKRRLISVQEDVGELIVPF